MKDADNSSSGRELKKWLRGHATAIICSYGASQPDEIAAKSDDSLRRLIQQQVAVQLKFSRER